MPAVVWVLGCAIFVQGTSELMIAGLLPEMASDLGVSIPDAGLLISAFAVGMLVGAPVLAVLTRRWPRRATLLGFMGIFAASHAVGALAPDYLTLLATRVVGAFVYAGFWAVAAVTAVGAVPSSARGRAMSIVAGGLTVSVLAGLPAGTALGQALGWRATFWVVAATSAAMTLGVALTMPAGRRDPAGSVSRLLPELRIIASPALALAYATTALATAALMVTYSYLTPIITDTAGLAPRWVPGVLAVYGLGALLGIAVGGRTADSTVFGTLLVGLAALIAVSIGLAWYAALPPVAISLIFVLGAVGFGTNPALQTRVLGLAENAPTLAAATNISAFNIGITAGPWLGGRVIDAGAGYPAVTWVGAALGVAALVVVALAARVHPSVTPPVTARSEPRDAAQPCGSHRCPA